MRIAIVSPYALAVPGGVQQQVLGLVEQLRRLGEDAYAVAPGAGEGSHRVDVGRWTPVRANRSRAPLALSPPVIGRVKAALAAADVIHVHEPLVPLVGWAALRSGKPTVLTFHADPSATVRSAYRWARKPLRILLGGRPATAVSRIAMQAIEPLELRPREIPNAIDIDCFRVPAARNPHQVAFVGRPDPRKGRDLLLSAWPEVRAMVPGASLVVIGGGDSSPVDGVRYLGRVSEEEKRQVLAASAVFCAPNRGGESFGITIVEGMAAGCAVVASNLEAFSDVLAGSGRLFPNGDQAGLVAALVEVLTDADLRGRLIRRAGRRVESFGWERVVAHYVDLYQLAIRASQERR